jgi:hypothetical protein
MRPYLKKPFTKIGLVEWLKMKALSSNPNTAKKRERFRRAAQTPQECLILRETNPVPLDLH